MNTQDTVTVTFSRAEYEALTEKLRQERDRLTYRDEDGWAPTLREHDLRFALETLEAAGRRIGGVPA